VQEGLPNPEGAQEFRHQRGHVSDCQERTFGLTLSAQLPIAGPYRQETWRGSWEKAVGIAGGEIVEATNLMRFAGMSFGR